MSSNVQISNLALSHIGINKEISDLQTERTAESLTCRRFLDICRESTLRDFNWPFAKRYASLALVESDPNDQWAYSYRYPTDCLKVRRVLSGLRNDTRQSRIPFEIASDDSGSLIYTDMQDASIEYTYKITNPERFASDFTMAMSYRLAALIAPRLISGESGKFVDNAMGMYRLELASARSNAINEQQEDELPDSEFIRGRV